jgi:hypothetical protein
MITFEETIKRGENQKAPGGTAAGGFLSLRFNRPSSTSARGVHALSSFLQRFH